MGMKSHILLSKRMRDLSPLTFSVKTSNNPGEQYPLKYVFFLRCIIRLNNSYIKVCPRYVIGTWRDMRDLSRLTFSVKTSNNPGEQYPLKYVFFLKMYNKT